MTNYSDDTGWYRAGQRRLAQHVKQQGIEFCPYEALPPGCLHTHTDRPYAFKPFCVLDAAAKTGRTLVLWMDSSAVPHANLQPIFDVMEKHGAFISANFGWRCEQWTTPQQWAILGLDRKKYGVFEHCSAAVCGFDLEHPVGKSLLDEWAHYANHTLAFVGPREINPPVDQCLGTRWDQTVLSLLAHKRGIPFQHNDRFVTYGKDSSGIVRLYPCQ